MTCTLACYENPYFTGKKKFYNIGTRTYIRKKKRVNIEPQYSSSTTSTAVTTTTNATATPPPPPTTTTTSFDDPKFGADVIKLFYSVEIS